MTHHLNVKNRDQGTKNTTEGFPLEVFFVIECCTLNLYEILLLWCSPKNMNNSLKNTTSVNFGNKIFLPEYSDSFFGYCFQICKISNLP